MPATGEPAPNNAPTPSTASTSATSSASDAAGTGANAPTGPGETGSIAFSATTQGWYITAAIAVSVVLANTPAGPLLLGVLGIGLLYQINQLVQGK